MAEPAQQLADVREHGVLFKAPMVLALLRGAKTMTRRLVSPQNSLINGHPMTKWARTVAWPALDFAGAWIDPGPSPAGNPGPYLKARRIEGDDEVIDRIYPRWQVGDRLWVKETWSPDHRDVYPMIPVVYAADGRIYDWETRDHVRGCTAEKGGPRFADCLACAGFKWRPSLLMPRRASRILLEITAIRPERLAEITEADVLAEGIVRSGAGTFEIEDAEFGNARDAFNYLWCGINGPESWERSDWCWATTFRRLEPA